MKTKTEIIVTSYIDFIVIEVVCAKTGNTLRSHKTKHHPYLAKIFERMFGEGFVEIDGHCPLE